MSKPSLILVSGAAGFIGRELCAWLVKRGYAVRAVVRSGGSRMPKPLNECLEVVEVDDLAGNVDYDALLDGVDRVVHLAGRSRVKGRQRHRQDLFFRDNLDAAYGLGQASCNFGVNRFVFLSTVKVNGEGVFTPVQMRPYRTGDKPSPEGAYAVSKWRSEQVLRRVFAEAHAADRLVIIRSPLVYGTCFCAPGNLAHLHKWLGWGLPLLIAAEEGRRSVVRLDRLVAEIVYQLLMVDKGKIIFPRGVENLTLSELAQALTGKKGTPVKMMVVPTTFLKMCLFVLGKQELYRKLYGSLLIDVEGDKGGSYAGDVLATKDA